MFPLAFTSYNDLSLEYFTPKSLERERTLTASGEEYAERLNEDPEAERVLGNCCVSAALCGSAGGFTGASRSRAADGP